MGCISELSARNVVAHSFSEKELTHSVDGHEASAVINYSGYPSSRNSTSDDSKVLFVSDKCSTTSGIAIVNFKESGGKTFTFVLLDSGNSEGPEVGPKVLTLTTNGKKPKLGKVHKDSKSRNASITCESYCCHYDSMGTIPSLSHLGRAVDMFSPCNYPKVP